MPYGTIKIDTVTFTDAGVDKSVTLSGLVQNPTFSGNVTVTGTLSGVTVTGTTANFTSGNFTNISGGTHTITSGVFAAGSAASPSITFTGDLNTGIYSPGADQVAISTGGSGRLFVDASGRIIVGAATAAIGIPLEIVSNAPGLAVGVRGRSADNIGIIGFYPNNSSTEYARIQSNGDSSLSFGTGPSGSERLRITSAGLVGVGSSSPVATNHIRGSGTSGQVTASWMLENASSGTVGMDVTGAAGSSIWRLLYGNGPSTGTNTLTPALTIGVEGSAAGRVGIGTTNVPAPFCVSRNGNEGLEVTPLTGNQVEIQGYNRTTSNWVAALNKFSQHIWNLNSTTEAARIDTSGRLLVGTSTVGGYRVSSTSYNPQAEIKGSFSSPSWGGSLAIVSTNQAGNLWLVNDTTNPASGDNLGVISFNGYDGTNRNQGASIAAQVDGTTGAGDLPSRLVFSTTADGASSPTERMRIANDGVVSISNGRLYIQKSDASNPLCYAYNTNNASTDVVYRSELGAGSNGTSAYHFYAVTGGSGKFAIYGNGTYGTISDQRLKTHIETARNGYLDDLNRLNIVKYGWKTDGLDQATELGVIAQEVEQVFPGLIQETPPNEDGEVYKGVKTSVFTFMLIKALQEASAKIETLEAKVAALESA